MPDIQETAFDWVTGGAQPGLTGAALLAMGLLYGLCGYRMIRSLVVVCAIGLGLLAGHLAASLTGLPPIIVLPAGGLLTGLAALKWRSAAIVATGGTTWALVGGYLTAQFGGEETTVLIVAGVLGLLGVILTLVSRAPMVVLFTTLQGAALIVLGMVGVASDAMPALGHTFLSLAGRNGAVVPILLLLMTITAYSYQATSRRGDIISGSEAGPNI